MDNKKNSIPQWSDFEPNVTDKVTPVKPTASSSIQYWAPEFFGYSATKRTIDESTGLSKPKKKVITSYVTAFLEGRGNK
jgi:hypothetical protein